MTGLLGVAEKLGTMVRELSLGERMKMELIAALLHEPRVLFLDEPTIGLDVVSQKAVRDFIRQHNATKRTTILLTSHYMADIQELCRRVIVIDRGRICFDGALAEIFDRFASRKVITIHLDPAAARSECDLSSVGEVIESDPGSIRLSVRRDQVIPACKVLLDRLPVMDMDIQELPIEEVIRQFFTEVRE
jgi:ABC-2 type transport system ATP-binding protein